MTSLHFTRRGGAVAAIIGVTLGLVYLSLALYRQVDGYLFPGNGLELPAVPAFVPGTNVGVDVSLPGVSSSGEKAWTPGSRLNILVLGLDLRPGEPADGPARADTMLVASIDKQQGRLQMLPARPLPGHPLRRHTGRMGAGEDQRVDSYGQFYKYPGGGAAAAVSSVEHNFNIDIHHYVVVDWVGFVELVDAIGGIDINVPTEVSDSATDVLECSRTIRSLRGRSIWMGGRPLVKGASASMGT